MPQEVTGMNFLVNNNTYLYGSVIAWEPGGCNLNCIIIKNSETFCNPPRIRKATTQFINH